VYIYLSVQIPVIVGVDGSEGVHAVFAALAHQFLAHGVEKF
jgi:hypothetical protein